jgi:hypothetical protein
MTTFTTSVELRQQSASVLGIAERQELDVLLDYIDQTQGAGFDRVDAIFASENVHLDNFTKLFAPNDLIVTMQEVCPACLYCQEILQFKQADPPCSVLDVGVRW